MVEQEICKQIGNKRLLLLLLLFLESTEISASEDLIALEKAPPQFMAL